MGDAQTVVRTGQMSAEEVRQHTTIAEDFYTVFSNQVRVAAAPTEFRLFFGENYPAPTGELRIVERLSVVITPVQAKLLGKLLTQTVQKIDEMFGTIPDLDSLNAKIISAIPATPATPATPEGSG